MGLFSDLDWIQLARDAKLGDDESIRSAMARVRDDAKSIFASKLAQALRRFTAAHDATLPSDLPQLLPFFDRPIDPADFGHDGKRIHEHLVALYDARFEKQLAMHRALAA